MLHGTMALSHNVAAQTSNPAQPQPEFGLWYDETGRGAIEIAPCGTNVCGRIVWLRNPLSQRGTPLRDINNPNAADRNNPICGLQVLGRLSRQPDGSLDGGWVYDPKVGKSYNVEVRQAGPNKLAVRGYLNVKLLGRTLSWTRAPSDLPRCDTAL
ncbi:MAG: DUF2147 domain-containing protein [Pseudomonadota bacterium]